MSRLDRIKAFLDNEEESIADPWETPDPWAENKNLQQLDLGLDVEVFVGSKEQRVYGPPGCGKTTYLENTVMYYRAKHPGDVMFLTSMTRSGASALARKISLQASDYVGTIHKACYHLLGKPEIAETHIEEFNNENPTYKLSPKADTLGSPQEYQGDTSLGDTLFSTVAIYRTQMIPREKWPTPVMKFWARWSTWKVKNDYLDFFDMIEIALEKTDQAPNKPDVLVCDEAQDGGLLILTLLRKWGQKAKIFILVGDDDQAIYTFTGARAEDFFKQDIPANRVKVLSQSYRIPQAVHEVVMPWVRQLPSRAEKLYVPRRTTYPDGEFVRGEVGRNSGTFKDPQKIVASAFDDVKSGKRVMIQASCGYMLYPLLDELKRRAIPFANPFRMTSASWNPLQSGGKLRVSATDRVLAFLRPCRDAWGDDSRPYTGDDLFRFTSNLRAKGNLISKKAIEELKDRDTQVDITEYLTPEAVERVNALDLQWFEDNLLPAGDTMKYPLKVASAHGGAMLRNRHGLYVGTWHSFKGHEADVNYVLPDLSRKFWGDWMSGRSGRSTLIRMGYVAMTRTKERLVLCSAAGSEALKFL